MHNGMFWGANYNVIELPSFVHLCTDRRSCPMPFLLHFTVMTSHFLFFWSLSPHGDLSSPGQLSVVLSTNVNSLCGRLFHIILFRQTFSRSFLGLKIGSLETFEPYISFKWWRWLYDMNKVAKLLGVTFLKLTTQHWYRWWWWKRNSTCDIIWLDKRAAPKTLWKQEKKTTNKPPFLSSLHLSLPGLFIPSVLNLCFPFLSFPPPPPPSFSLHSSRCQPPLPLFPR